MKETTHKLLQGRLGLLAASLFFVTAALRAWWGDSSGIQTALSIVAGAMFLFAGIRSLRRARRPK